MEAPAKNTPENVVHIAIGLETIQALLARHALHVSDFSCDSEQSKALIHEALLKSLRS
ncbi:hypothetical protein [Salinimonas chungwhensis]|uniref:hypothetical protein n=1 Tax=Salinimonas chungwhensis TaxID=265425 RepID=UPI00037FDE6A|nr:hypothetical protein [Salinimonas chungwhensis]